MAVQDSRRAAELLMILSIMIMFPSFLPERVLCFHTSRPVTAPKDRLERTLKRLPIREAVEQVAVLGSVGGRGQIEHLLE